MKLGAAVVLNDPLVPSERLRRCQDWAVALKRSCPVLGSTAATTVATPEAPDAGPFDVKGTSHPITTQTFSDTRVEGDTTVANTVRRAKAPC